MKRIIVSEHSIITFDFTERVIYRQFRMDAITHPMPMWAGSTRPMLEHADAHHLGLTEGEQAVVYYLNSDGEQKTFTTSVLQQVLDLAEPGDIEVVS